MSAPGLLRAADAVDDPVPVAREVADDGVDLCHGNSKGSHNLVSVAIKVKNNRVNICSFAKSKEPTEMNEHRINGIFLAKLAEVAKGMQHPIKAEDQRPFAMRVMPSFISSTLKLASKPSFLPDSFK